MKKQFLFALALAATALNAAPASARDYVTACDLNDYERLQNVLTDANTQMTAKDRKNATLVASILREESMATTCDQIVSDQIFATIPGRQSDKYVVTDTEGKFEILITEDVINHIVKASVTKK